MEKLTIYVEKEKKKLHLTRPRYNYIYKRDTWPKRKPPLDQRYQSRTKKRHGPLDVWGYTSKWWGEKAHLITHHGSERPVIFSTRFLFFLSFFPFFFFPLFRLLPGAREGGKKGRGAAGASWYGPPRERERERERDVEDPNRLKNIGLDLILIESPTARRTI